MLISDEDIEEAIKYLAETDAKLGQAKYRVEALATKKDLTEKEVFLHCTGNVEERKAEARTHEQTKEAQREYLTAMREYETLKNQRDTAHVKIWVWRSIKSSERTTV